VGIGKPNPRCYISGAKHRGDLARAEEQRKGGGAGRCGGGGGGGTQKKGQKNVEEGSRKSRRSVELNLGSQLFRL